MPNLRLLSMFCCLLFLVVAVAAVAQQNKGTYKLVWSDEFDKPGLPNTAKWGYDTGAGGWGNHELENYTVKRLRNARVENGMLIVEARKENYQGSAYTSARLLTRGKQDWTYGKFEIRAKLPKGRGTWPAIWMLGSHNPLRWPDDGEIDIMEHVGFHQGFIHGSIHTKAYNHVIKTQRTDTLEVPDCSEKFHVYGLEWTPEFIAMSVDGKEYFRFANEHKTRAEWPYAEPEFLLLNLAVGGDWGGAKGVDESIWPQRMLVDYVRVYQKL